VRHDIGSAGWATNGVGLVSLIKNGGLLAKLCPQTVATDLALREITPNPGRGRGNAGENDS